LVLLAELRIRGQKPKLGSLQRWVRECDAASIGKGHGEIVWDVLEAILRTTGEDPRSHLIVETTPSGILRHEPWLAGSPALIPVWNRVESKTLVSASDEDRIRSIFKPLQTTPGPQRRPPNLYPSIIYFSPPESIPLLETMPTVRRHDHPNVNNAFLLQNVFNVEECTSIIKMSETLGMIADQPVGGSAVDMVSVSADMGLAFTYLLY
jgi:hypothetical protein